MIRSNSRIAVASLVFVLCAGGCTSMQVAKGYPARIIADKQPSVIEIRRVDGSRIRLYRPVVLGDTIWGSMSEDSPKPDGAVAQKDVSAVFTPQASGGKTIVLVLSIVGILAALVSASLPTGGFG